MKNKKAFFAILSLNLFLGASCSDSDCNTIKEETKPFTMPDKAFVLAEQARSAIVIRDAETGVNVWSWDPYTAEIPSSQQSWFVNPSEVKPVYNKKYILMTASGGAVALIRVSDHKMMFYANCGTNPHSAELLPDGNIVTAESSSGEINTFVVDTVKVLGTKCNTIKIGNAHNVVWDNSRSCLYATGTITAGVTALFRFKYNGDSSNPTLTGQTRVYTFEKESGGHDLFPVYGEESKLWLSAASAVYQFDVSSDTPSCEKVYDMADIKSICDGPDGVLMLKPTEEWWAESLINENGETLFQMHGAKIYKGRWVIDNTFSYPVEHNFVLGGN